MTKKFAPEIRNLACALSDAGRALARIAELLEAEEGTPATEDEVLATIAGVSAAEDAADRGGDEGLTRAVAEPEPALEVEPRTAGPEPTREPWDWEEILPAARRLLAEDPSTEWRPTDLARELQARGVSIPTLHGIHWALLSRMRGDPQVVERGGRLRGKEAVRAEVPWAEVVRTAIELIRADPSRSWRPAELVRAVRDAGVPLPALRGVHFGLVPRLREAGEISVDDEGLLHAQTGQQLATSVAPPSPGLQPSPGAAEVPKDTASPGASPLTSRGASPSASPGGAPGSSPRASSGGVPGASPLGSPGASSLTSPGASPHAPSGASSSGSPGASLSASPGGSPLGSPGASSLTSPGASPLGSPGASPSAPSGASLSASPGGAPRSSPLASPSGAPGSSPQASPGGVPGASPRGSPSASPLTSPGASPHVSLGAPPLTSPGSPPGASPLSPTFASPGASAIALSANELPLDASQPEATEPRSIDEELAALKEEVEVGEPYLDVLDTERRTSQLATWAGRARELQDFAEAEGVDPSVSLGLHRLFGLLTRLTREHHCGWIDALSRRFTTDWGAYVHLHQSRMSGHPPELGETQLAALFHDLLRGLQNPDRSGAQGAAAELIAEALEHLEPTDPEILAASRRFGDPLGVLRGQTRPRSRARREASAQQGGPQLEVDARLTAATRGLRALMVGGQGTREDQRSRLQEIFGFTELEWVTSERGQAAHYDRLSQRVRAHSYDLVLFVSAFTSHKSAGFLRECKAAQVPIVYLNRGYGVNRVALALREQWARPSTW